LTAQTRVRGQDAEQLVGAIVEATPVPVENVRVEGR
jgi:hypothetical protein